MTDPAVDSLPSFDLRRQRLWGLLPWALAAQPEGSAIGALIDSMAWLLARFDFDAQAVIRNHWVDTAIGSRGIDKSALDYLGALLACPRHADENEDDYRCRLAVTGRVLTSGLTTVDAVLDLAIAALGAEPCQQRVTDRGAVVARAMPPGVTGRCPRCHGGGGVCPNGGDEVFQAWITENPPEVRSIEKPGLRPGTTFRLGSGSASPLSFSPEASEILPLIELGVPKTGRPVVNPAIRNVGTNETVVYDGVLQPGECLILRPAVTAAGVAWLQARDSVAHYPWRRTQPDGAAVLRGADGTERPPPPGKVLLLGGCAFADITTAEPSRFAGLTDTQPTFAALSSNTTVLTPRLRTEPDPWRFDTVGAKELGRPDDAVAAAPTADATIDLRMTWWIRPPASFRLRIAKTDWVKSAVSRGGDDRVRAAVDRARAAGVTARIDYPDAPLSEDQPLGEGPQTATVTIRIGDVQPLADAAPRINARLAACEDHGLAEGAAAQAEPGQFDRSQFDRAHFATEF